MSKLPNEICPRCHGWVWHRSEPCNCKLTFVAHPQNEPEYLKLVGQRIRSARCSKGLGLDALAEKAHMSKTGLWQIENGHSEPMARTLVALANALEVTTDFLLLR